LLLGQLVAAALTILRIFSVLFMQPVPQFLPLPSLLRAQLLARCAIQVPISQLLTLSRVKLAQLFAIALTLLNPPLPLANKVSSLCALNSRPAHASGFAALASAATKYFLPAATSAAKHFWSTTASTPEGSVSASSAASECSPPSSTASEGFAAATSATEGLAATATPTAAAATTPFPGGEVGSYWRVYCQVLLSLSRLDQQQESQWNKGEKHRSYPDHAAHTEQTLCGLNVPCPRCPCLLKWRERKFRRQTISAHRLVANRTHRGRMY
jgi:hypothetical protein